MSRVDLVTQVAQQLEEAILGGQYQPGEPLPPEREISAQLGVSRSVVREAIGRLTSLGLIRSVHGSGNRVEVPSSQPIRLGYRRLLTSGEVRLEDLSALRLPLETAIAALAAQQRGPEHLERLEQTQKVLSDPHAALEEQIKADLEFHTALAEATGNPLFQLVLEPIQELLIASRRLTLGRYGAEVAYRHHAEILAAVRAGDTAAAIRAMQTHLETNYAHLHGQSADFP